MKNTIQMPLLAAALACVLAVSCDTPTSGDGGGGEPDVVLDRAKFYANNYKTGNYYTLTAEKKAVGQKCEVWIEQGAGITSADAKAIAAEYDNKIYGRMRDAFDTTVTLDDGTAMSLFDAADYLGNGDGRLLLLLLDIRDKFAPPSEMSYVGGLFDPKDLPIWTTLSLYSNKADMIYVDINPGKQKSPQFYATIAHELQHLLHLTADVVWRTQSKVVTEQDVWINEGLSSAAEWLYLKDHAVTGRIDQFNEQEDIPKGNTFFVWDGVLADYATGYLFFQWLRIQSGSADIYRDILMSGKSDYTAVTEEAAKIDASYSGWETLLRSWFAANYAPSGPYGYKGEISKSDIKVRSASGSGSIGLRPGEGVYSDLKTVQAASGNIRYAGLTEAGAVNVTQGQAGDLILTYNVSTTKGKNPDGTDTGTSETGTIAASQVSAGAPAASKAAAPGEPYRIDARDLLGGRRPGALPDGGLSDVIKRLRNPDGR
ncbi:MAG: hypothetical protein LBG57_02385 [Treponema sp.]|nr:hypothetical protein [Treponema sp.]